RAPAPLASDQLPRRPTGAAARRPHDDRLEQAVLPDRLRQLCQLLLAELTARLERIRRQIGDGQLPRLACGSRVFAQVVPQQRAEAASQPISPAHPVPPPPLSSRPPPARTVARKSRPPAPTRPSAASPRPRGRRPAPAAARRAPSTRARAPDSSASRPTGCRTA